MKYACEDKPKLVPVELRKKVADIVRWAAIDLGVMEPTVKYFVLHDKQALHRACKKNGEPTFSFAEVEPAGFWDKKYPNTIWLRTLTFYNGRAKEEFARLVIHETRHYWASTKGLNDNAFFDKEEDAYAWEYGAIKRYLQFKVDEAQADSRERKARLAEVKREIAQLDPEEARLLSLVDKKAQHEAALSAKRHTAEQAQTLADSALLRARYLAAMGIDVKKLYSLKG